MLSRAQQALRQTPTVYVQRVPLSASPAQMLVLENATLAKLALDYLLQAQPARNVRIPTAPSATTTTWCVRNVTRDPR